MEQVEDRFELNRFVTAQEDSYSAALSELKAGQKRSHWMWYVFPQIDGLGQTSMSKRYSIKSLDEAREYLQHPVLGARLKECVEAILGINNRSASEIFGFPDVLKLKSSMTLFEQAAENDSVFSSVLEKYYQGERDQRTLELLNQMSKI